ncbi:MAG: glycoside hydrolase family 97 N-terminal domain-containing protein [Rikenellaceae bacterium]
MKKILLLAVAFATFAMVSCQSGSTLKSPDGAFKFNFEVSEEGGELLYSINYMGEELITQGEMGLNIEGVEDMKNLKVLSNQHSKVKNSWQPPYGERAVIEDNYNKLLIELGSADATALTVEVRAYDQGVAFRYSLPEGTPMKILSEKTDFTLPLGTIAYYTYRAQARYEARQLKDWGENEISERPLTMQLPSGKFAAIAEANMVDYSRGKLALNYDKESTVVVSMASAVDVETPYSTPWRVVMAAEKSVDLINNNDIILNLSDECQIEDTSWIRPGKVYRCELSQDYVLGAIDFAAERNYQYVHLDAGWYGPEFKWEEDARTIGDGKDLNIAELCAAAKAKGLGVILYVNHRALEQQMDELLPLYKEWGVSGIKFGFVNVGSQEWTEWLHEGIRKCAEYGLIADVHDEYRPTGYSRTYPNFMSQEGIDGNETMPDATHNVTLAFTRMLCGAADYTFCYYSPKVKNTKGHQLALPVIYYSPLQFMHWYDKFHLYSDEQEMEFWSAIPTVWDDSRAIEGEIGEYIIQTRRSGDEWFVGAITNTSPRQVTIKTGDFLTKGKEYKVGIYEDDETLETKSKVKTSYATVKGGEELTFELLASGGVSLHFTEI